MSRADGERGGGGRWWWWKGGRSDPQAEPSMGLRAARRVGGLGDGPCRVCASPGRSDCSSPTACLAAGVATHSRPWRGLKSGSGLRLSALRDRLQPAPSLASISSAPIHPSFLALLLLFPSPPSSTTLPPNDLLLLLPPRSASSQRTFLLIILVLSALRPRPPSVLCRPRVQSPTLHPLCCFAFVVPCPHSHHSLHRLALTPSAALAHHPPSPTTQPDTDIDIHSTSQ